VCPLAARQDNPARSRAGRDDDCLAAQGPDGVDSAPDDEVDAVVAPVLRRTQEQLRRLAFARKELLGQRRPFVGTDRLVPDERDATAVPLGPQRLGATRTGEAGADDQD
jgi:hypothetical protein